METLTKYLCVAAGGALGAALRYYLGGTVLARTAAPFPTATFVINVSGSFVLGLFLTLATERVHLSTHLRLAVAVGFVGAYTTFSTFEYETAKLIEDGELARALLNVVLSFAAGLLAVWLGIYAARKFQGAPPSGPAPYRQFGPGADAAGPRQPPGAERDVRDSSIERGC